MNLMRNPLLGFILLVLTAWPCCALGAAGSLSYDARVVHNNRSGISYVHGEIDLATGNYKEQVLRSYVLDFRSLPGALKPTRPTLPTLWQVDGRIAQQYGSGIPHFDNPQLRNFLVNRIIANPASVKPEAEFLKGQLVVVTADFGDEGFEVVAAFREAPLVIVGDYRRQGADKVISEMAVLGPRAELYQYFFDEVSVSRDGLEDQPVLPDYNPDDYISFPEGATGTAAIRPVKDWLVFQAQLPGGRPLNLILDSGAETMIMDDMVLKVDAQLDPVGELPVAAALKTEHMNLYEGFSFEVGGVEFKNMSIIGIPLTNINIGAGMRIHGIVGSEILQLCRLDLDMAEGLMQLSPLGSGDRPEGEEVGLTFIEDLPHLEAEVEDTGRALMLLDTGQRSAVSVNLDWLDQYEMSDDLKMDGFLGDVAGGLAPRYILEKLNVSLGAQTYNERTVDTAPENTYRYDGVPVVGSIGFPMLARHFGGLTIDYREKKLYLRDPGESYEFTGRLEAWDEAGGQLLIASADLPGQEPEPVEEVAGDVPAEPPVTGDEARDPRRPTLDMVYDEGKEQAKRPFESGKATVLNQADTGPGPEDEINTDNAREAVDGPQGGASDEVAPEPTGWPVASRLMELRIWAWMGWMTRYLLLDRGYTAWQPGPEDLQEHKAKTEFRRGLPKLTFKNPPHTEETPETEPVDG